MQGAEDESPVIHSQLHRTVCASGGTIDGPLARAETKTPKRPLQFNRQCAETKCVPNRRQFGAIRTEPGNFQPNDYRSLALSVSNGPACGDFLASEVPKVAELPCTSTLSLQIGD